MFNTYRDVTEVERDFCDKLLDQCYQKGLEIMNVNLTEDIYNVWFQYASDCIQEVANKTNDSTLLSEFHHSRNIHVQYYFEIVSENLKALNSIRKKVFNYYMNVKPTNTKSESFPRLSQQQPLFTPSYNYKSYANPYIMPNTQELRYLSPVDSHSKYNSYYNGLSSILTTDNSINDQVVLSILNSTGNSYNKSSFLNLPIGVAKIISDTSIDFLASKLKEEYPNDNTAHLVIDGIKELAKEKMKCIIDEWYRNKRYTPY